MKKAISRVCVPADGLDDSEIGGRSSGVRNAYPDDGNYNSNSYGLNRQLDRVPLVPDELVELRHEFRIEE